MWARRLSRRFVLLVGVVLVALLYAGYNNFRQHLFFSENGQSQPKNDVVEAKTYEYPVQRPNGIVPTRRAPLPALSPLADMQALAKTQPQLGELKSQIADMEFLRQSGITSTKWQIPNQETLKSWSQKQLSYFFHSSLDNIQLLCKQVMKMGDFFAWGNFVCDDDEYRLPKPCLAYSFRVDKKDALFEDDVGKLYGCQVYLFDPGAPSGMTHSSLVTVSNKVLENNNLTKLQESLGHKVTPLDLLKIDLNGGEWNALSEMAAAGELSQVRQLLVSLTVPAAQSQQAVILIQNLAVLKGLQDAGFRIFRSVMRETAEKLNGVYLLPRTITYELCLVNTKVQQRVTSNQSTLPVAAEEENMIFLRQLKKPIAELPALEELSQLPAKTVHNLYHRYLDNPTIQCNLMVKMGQLIDGGYKVCDDLPFRPASPCLVYSFGIKEDFSFDDDTARFYGCDVFSFDPSMSKSFRRWDKVTFYKLGIGGVKGVLEKSMWFPAPGKNSDWRIESFTDIKQLLGHQNRTVDIFKIDTEGAEWPSIADMARAGELSTIKQLIVEFHLWNGEDVNIARNELSVIAELARAGYRIFHSHMYAGWDGIPRLRNVYPVMRTITYEVSFVNTLYQPPT